MKKHVFLAKLLTILTFTGILSFFSTESFAQCNNGSAWGSGTIGGPGSIITLTTCAFAGEYSTINGVVAGTPYISYATGGSGNFITIRQGTSNGPVVAFGPSPLSWTATASGVHYQHVNLDAGCATDAVCHTQIVENAVPPPPPIGCINATMIACGATVSGTTVGAPNDLVSSCGTTNGNGGKVWYEFTGTGADITASLCSGTSYDSKLWVFSGNCLALTCVGGNDDDCGTQSTVTFTSVLGTTYYIIVGGFSSNEGSYTLNLTCAPPPGPGDCIHPTAYGNQNIPNDNTPVTQGCAFAGEYITFNNTSTGENYSFSSSTGSDWLTLTDASNNVIMSGTSPLLWTATFSGTVRVHVSLNSICQTQAACRDITAQCLSCAPFVSPCESATPIACGQTVSGSTVGAPTDAVPTCVTTTGTGGKVWYEFIGTGEVVTATTCSALTNYDTKLWVFSGDCDNLVCVTGNDDMGAACGFSGAQSNVEFVSTLGETYYIVVGGWSTEQGNYTLNLTCAPAPVIPGCATNINFAIPSCGTGDISITWDAVAEADNYNIYAGTAPGLNDIANPFAAGDVTEILLQNPLPNTTYYITVVPSSLAGEAVGCVELSFTSPDVCPPPANDDICDAIALTNTVAQDLNTYAFLADLTCDNNIGNNENGTPSVVGPSCGAANGNDTWYSFTTPMCDVGGTVPFTIELTTNNPGTNYDTKMALFISDDNTCTGNLTQVICNDDNGFAGAPDSNPNTCGANLSGFVSAIVIDALLPNTQYWVYIGGFNGSTGTYELSGRALAPAHGVSAVGGGTQIQLTTANMGAGLYTYYYKQVGSPGYSTFNSPSALTDTRTLSPGSSYQTQIMYRCGSNFDQSQWYRTAPQTIALASTCADVQDMTCTFNGPNSYTLTWTQPAGELFTNNGALSGYRIKRNPVGSTGVFTFSNPAVVCVDGTCSVTLPGNSPTGFNWTIETRCSANTVQVGNTTSCGPAPEMTLGNDANNNTDKSMQHTFSFVNAEAGIEFVDVQMHDAYADFGLNTPMFGDYEMYVNSKNEITWRRVDASVDMNFDFVIVPNPSNAMTTVHLNTVVEAGTFTIVDAMGRTINSGAISNTDNVNIDAAQLQSGVYMVVVTVGNQQLTRRLVVAD